MSKTTQLTVALYNIRSLYNVGSILRTCSFFNIKKVILLGFSGRKSNQETVLHPKIDKTALGSQQDLEISFIPDFKSLEHYAQQNKYQLIAIEQQPKSISLFEWEPKTDKLILIMGAEKGGLPKEDLEKCDQIIEIPKPGQHNSLNVTIACGIVIAKLVDYFQKI